MLIEHDVLVREGVLAARCCQAKDDSRYRGRIVPRAYMYYHCSDSTTPLQTFQCYLYHTSRRLIESESQRMYRVLRIGVDVGGCVRGDIPPQILANQPISSTNTDGVILDPTKASEPGKGVVAWYVITSENSRRVHYSL
jgi:hypothetical protein